MTLPNINETINFDIEVPSFKRTLKARPYLTKEEKILMFASETNDPKQVLKAMMQVISNCVTFDGKETINDMTMFDIEYAFVQLRSISVGETTEVKIKCESCQHENEVTINFEDIKFEHQDEYTKLIPLMNDIKLEVGYPYISNVVKYNIFDGMEMDDKLSTDYIFKIVKSLVKKIHTSDELLIFSEYSEKEQDEFIGNLTNKQLMEIINFVKEVPSSVINVEFDCASCSSHNDMEVRGIQNFFT